MAEPARLAAIGDAVRARLLLDARARPLGGHRADIFALTGFLSAERCRALITPIEAGASPSKLYNDGGEAPGIRTSSTHYFGDAHAASELAVRIDDLLGLPRNSAEPMQGQRYRPGEEYRHHSDSFRTGREHWQRERLRGGQRSWTAMLYLNAVETGGETDFPKLGLKIAPEPGLLLAWNNMDRRGRPNPMLLHAGLPVERGSKYIVTQWYRLGDWSARPRDAGPDAPSLLQPSSKKLA